MARDIHRVGDADKHYVGKIVVDLQMVVERVILLGVEYFSIAEADRR